MKRSVSAAVVGTAALAASLAVAGPATAATPAPDLVVTDVAWSPQVVSAGDQVTFRATIKNRGTKATPSGVVHGVGFGIGRATVTWSDDVTRSLRPGESITVTADGGQAGSTWTAAEGTTVVRAYVDDARRIRESNEGNNVRAEKVTATAGFRTSMQGASPVVEAPPSDRDTGVANEVTGTGYGACFTEEGTRVPGTEKPLRTYSAGNTEYRYAAPFGGNGDVLVPASRTASRVVGQPIDVNEIVKYSYGDPDYLLGCPAGSFGRFTRLDVTTLVSHRYALDATGGPTELLGTHTQAVDVRIAFG
ncbi:CARDB domain-containing protein [Kineococcus sp. G2]|uniref:CARDB domain-containing protein n=1 Tax=Kineococcus sp. G2 TaxID=3127484 RepID=UPI00301CDC45